VAITEVHGNGGKGMREGGREGGRGEGRKGGSVYGLGIFFLRPVLLW
jgi:hypothetical protein